MPASMHESNWQFVSLEPERPFEVSYAPADRLRGHVGDECHTLAQIHYDADKLTASSTSGRIVVPVEPLGAPLVEVWRSAEPVEKGQQRGIFYRRNSGLLAGHLSIAEREHKDLEAAVCEAYAGIFDIARRQGYSHPLRIWNFLPDINRHEGGLERYQAFCEGRHRALERVANEPALLPAASTIGTQGDELQIYFIAASEPGLQVENPRQVSAFHYPPRYSPKSPSFSRAVVKQWDEVTHLYISGTASIVGHETRHLADTLAQLDETLENLDALVRHAAELSSLGIASVRDLTLLKVYVREPHDYEAIVTRLTQKLGPEKPLMLLRGDICRGDLRLEIEGLYTETGGC